MAFGSGKILGAILIAGAGTIALAAVAQEIRPRPPVPGGDIHRYTFRPVQDGLLRIDRRTGQRVHCRRRGDSWACDEPARDTAGSDKEIARLSDKVKTLEIELSRRTAADAEVVRLQSRVQALESELTRRSAEEAELATLRARVAALEAELARRATEPAAPTPPQTVPPQAAPQPAPSEPSVKPEPWPSDREVERAMRYLEDLFRRFLAMVERLRRDGESQRI